MSGERQNGTPLPLIEVHALQFDGMSWVSAWGAQAFIYAGQGVKDHTRVAIRTLSGGVPREAVYAHLGWKRIDGEMVYLQHGGGIGKNGLVPGISVNLGDNRLKDYSLPEPPSGEQVKPPCGRRYFF